MKILAIDIGSSQIKAVVLESRFRRFDLVFHQVVAVPDALDDHDFSQSNLSAGQIQALNHVTNSLPWPVDRVLTNVPLTAYSSRKMTFPFQNRKKIRSAIQFAIEDEVPFNIDDCVYSFQVFTEKGEKDATVLNSIAPAESMRSFLHSLSQAKLDPDVIGTDQSAIGDFIDRKKELFSAKGIAIIDIGHRKANTFFFDSHKPLYQKTTMVGGYHITRAIAETYKLGIKDAELAKIQRGFLATRNMQLNNDQKQFAHVIGGALDAFFHDLNQSFMAYTSKFSARIDKVYVCGGTSLLPGFKETITERFGCEVLPLKTVSALEHVSLKVQDASETYLAQATCLALTQTQPYVRNSINLRSGILRKESEALKIPWQKVAYPAKLAAIVYVLAILSFSAQKIISERQAKSQKRIAERLAKRVFKTNSRSLLYKLLSESGTLRKQGDSKIKALESQLTEPMESFKADFSTLQVVDSLSKSVPRSAVMEIRKASFTERKVQLTVESPTQQNAANAISALKRDPGVSAAKDSKIQKLRSGRFQFKFEFVPKKQGG